MTARELFDSIGWSTEKEYTAQLLDRGGLSVNISDFYTTLIKDAARTNRFSCDIIRPINNIDDQLNNFKAGDEWKPVFIGCRRDGVNDTEYVLSSISSAGSRYRDIVSQYFAFYGVDVVKEKEYHNFYKVKICELWT